MNIISTGELNNNQEGRVRDEIQQTCYDPEID